MKHLKFLIDLNIQYKLTILISIPIMGLFYFAYDNVRSNYVLKNQSDTFEHLVNFSVHSNILVHELQKERGASAGYLSSQGKKFANKLPKKRLLTDEKYESFSNYLNKLDRSHYNAETNQALTTIEGYLSQLKAKRAEVSSLNISVAKAVEYYTKTNASLLNISSILAKQSPNGYLSNLATAYSTFVQSKERAGLERAVLANVFAKDKFSEGMLNKLNNLITTQDLYLRIFSDSAPPKYVKFFEEKMSHKSIAYVQNMRDIALANAESGGFNIDPEYWFEAITQKITVLKEIEDFFAEDIDKTALALVSSSRSAVTSSSIKAAIILIASVLLGFFLSRKVANSISSASIVANKIAAGELGNEIEVHSKDEAGQLMQALSVMQEKLKTVIESTQSTAHIVSSSAQEIAQGNLNLSDRTEQQASSLEETAASMEEMTSTVKQNADNAKQANQLARAARDQAEKGGAVVGDAVTAMNDINESSKKIADIIGVIDEIAFQTNLLALNAAVEAARAGEQGRGFAVVASEVRNLAGRSATAAKEIKDLIQDSVTKIDSGAELVNQSGQTLEEIVTSVKKVSDIIAEIAAASQEQSAGIDEVGKAIMQMDDLTQQNAALVEQAAASSETMGTKAKSLNEMLSFFSISAMHDGVDAVPENVNIH